MASDSSQAIAQVYAEALFELALQSQQHELVRRELTQLADLVRANPDWALFLESPALGREHKTAVIARVFAGKISDLTMDFLHVLSARDRLALLPEIDICYVQLEDDRAGRVRGTLLTAVELDNKELSRLTEQIGRALRKIVTLHSSVDPAIIGGLILNVQGLVIDASVRHSLKQFTRQVRQRVQNQLRASEILAG